MADEFQFEFLKDGILFAIAIWGASLSTYTFLANRRKDTRSIKLKLFTVMHTFGSDIGPRIAKIEATNTGQRPVTISTLTLETASGGRMFPLQKNRYEGMQDSILPLTLSDGQSAQMFISYREIGLALRKGVTSKPTRITPVCVDSVGGIYNGEPWDVVAEELI